MALVLCEGKATEPSYFQGLVKAWRLSNVEVRPATGSAPMTVVQDAIEAQVNRRRAAESSSVLLPFDELWCVFDVDRHPNLHTAIALAAENGIEIALSNPSFEYWLLLHFERDGRTLTSEQAVSRLKHHLKGYKKGYDYSSQLLSRIDVAVANAEDVLRSQHHLKNPSAFSIAEAVPSSRVPQLIRAIRPQVRGA